MYDKVSERRENDERTSELSESLRRMARLLRELPSKGDYFVSNIITIDSILKFTQL